MRRLLIRGILTAMTLTSTASVAFCQFAPSAPPPPSEVLPPPQSIPVPPPPAVIPVRPLTVSEFVASFRPLPGTYEALLIHPKTGCPVKVCFTLPPGCIRRVRVNGHKIEFVYKCQRDVVIRFLHNGRVWIRG